MYIWPPIIQRWIHPQRYVPADFDIKSKFGRLFITPDLTATRHTSTPSPTKTSDWVFTLSDLVPPKCSDGETLTNILLSWVCSNSAKQIKKWSEPIYVYKLSVCWFRYDCQSGQSWSAEHESYLPTNGAVLADPKRTWAAGGMLRIVMRREGHQV